MSGVAEKIQKRRFYPVTIDGETFHVRALSVADRRRIDAMSDVMQKSFFALGRGLCNEQGGELFPRENDEDDAGYATRIESLIPEIPTDTFNELGAAINRVGIVPRAEVIAKN